MTVLFVYIILFVVCTYIGDIDIILRRLTSIVNSRSTFALIVLKRVLCVKQDVQIVITAGFRLLKIVH